MIFLLKQLAVTRKRHFDLLVTAGAVKGTLHATWRDERGQITDRSAPSENYLGIASIAEKTVGLTPIKSPGQQKHETAQSR